MNSNTPKNNYDDYTLLFTFIAIFLALVVFLYDFVSNITKPAPYYRLVFSIFGGLCISLAIWWLSPQMIEFLKQYSHPRSSFLPKMSILICLLILSICAFFLTLVPFPLNEYIMICLTLVCSTIILICIAVLLKNSIK